PMIKRALLVAATLGLAAIASCSSDNNTTSDASMPTVDAPSGPCGARGGNLTMCSNMCVDTKRDPANCGACAKACGNGQVCVQGGCAANCGAGTTKCNNLCVDQKSDPHNCGQCGNKCVDGQVCNMGKCAATCQQGLTDCTGACLDLQSDD